VPGITLVCSRRIIFTAGTGAIWLTDNHQLADP